MRTYLLSTIEKKIAILMKKVFCKKKKKNHNPYLE